MNWQVQRPKYESIKESTCLKKYGVDNVSKVDVFKEKAKQTMKNKYGDTYVHTQQFKEYMKENKNTKYYKIAIKTWTVMNPLKRETAKKWSELDGIFYDG